MDCESKGNKEDSAFVAVAWQSYAEFAPILIRINLVPLSGQSRYCALLARQPTTAMITSDKQWD